MKQRKADRTPTLPTDAPPRGSARQQATVALRIGRHARFKASVDVSDTGLLAIGGLVAMTLLSTALLVRTATRSRSGSALQHDEAVRPSA